MTQIHHAPAGIGGPASGCKTTCRGFSTSFRVVNESAHAVDIEKVVLSFVGLNGPSSSSEVAHFLFNAGRATPAPSRIMLSQYAGYPFQDVVKSADLADLRSARRIRVEITVVTDDGRQWLAAFTPSRKELFG